MRSRLKPTRVAYSTGRNAKIDPELSRAQYKANDENPVAVNLILNEESRSRRPASAQAKDMNRNPGALLIVGL
jgi:hypothetical protein